MASVIAGPHSKTNNFSTLGLVTAFTLFAPHPQFLLDPFLPVLSRSCTRLSLGDTDGLLPQILFRRGSSPRGGECEESP